MQTVKFTRFVAGNWHDWICQLNLLKNKALNMFLEKNSQIIFAVLQNLLLLHSLFRKRNLYETGPIAQLVSST